MPVEGAGGLALVALSFLALYFLCIALAHAIVAIMNAVANALQGLPGIGGTLAGAVDAIARWISHAAGVLGGGIDKMIGGAWHLLSNYIDHALEQFVEHSSAILHLAQLVGNGIYSVSGLRAFVRATAYAAHAALHLADKLEREYHGIEAKLRAIEHEIGAGIGNDVRTSVDHLLKWEKVARADIKTLEGEIGRDVPIALADVESFLGIKPGIRWLDWAGGIVTAALGLEVFNLLRCNFLKGLFNNRGCGLWSALDDLLGLFADGILFADLCQVPAWINEIFGPIEGFLVGLISDAANAACAQPPASYTFPNAKPAALPPSQSIGTLPG